MIMVTGANGQLASLTLHELAERHVTALGGSRMPADGQRRLDFDDPASLDVTFRCRFCRSPPGIIVASGAFGSYPRQSIVSIRPRARF